MFTFVNAYISNYIYAFYVRDFYTVALNLVVIIILTNIGLNLVEYCIGKFWINHKIKKVAAKYEDEITTAEAASKGSETQYVWWYNEAMTQFGWIAFFAFVFPAAP